MLTSDESFLIVYDVLFPLDQLSFFLQSCHVSFIYFRLRMKILFITGRLVMWPHDATSS